jgi:hypothetical protein
MTAFVCGALFAGAYWWSLQANVAGDSNSLRGAVEESGSQVELSALKAEIERLKGVVPDQAHAMSDVEHHFANLWFAGKAGNWSLAEFYWKETVSHIKWAIRIIPVRKDNAGREVKLESIFQAIENTPHLKLGEVIARQNPKEFESTYRKFLEEGCYACHKASDKPYLRPRVPELPASSMINFDPKAKWPK